MPGRSSALNISVPLLEPWAGFAGRHNPLAQVIAPLAISFYTFQQISFLVDVGRGKVQLDGIIRYMSFVAFFSYAACGGPSHCILKLGRSLASGPSGRARAKICSSASLSLHWGCSRRR